MQKQDRMKARAPENQQHLRIKGEGKMRRIIRENKVKLWLIGNTEWNRVIHIRNGDRKK